MPEPTASRPITIGRVYLIISLFIALIFCLVLMGRAFQPLYTTKARGMGLGLVVVKNLTEAKGGAVEVQSEAGQGATFSITLPGGQPEAEVA